MDFGVVHSLAFPECKDGEGPILETLTEIVTDEIFGAVEIAPIRDPRLRAKARDLLSWSGLQVVYLPILPILFDNLGLGSNDKDRRLSARERLHTLIDEATEFDAPLAMVAARPTLDQSNVHTSLNDLSRITRNSVTTQRQNPSYNDYISRSNPLIGILKRNALSARPLKPPSWRTLLTAQTSV